MAGRIAVTAVAAGTVAIVSGIVGIVALTDAGARADDAGSRVSVAHIDVAAPVHPTTSPTATADADIPAPDAGAVTVPAPDPGEVTAPVAHAGTTTAKEPAASSAHDAAPAQNAPAQNVPAQSDQGKQDHQGDQNGKHEKKILQQRFASPMAGTSESRRESSHGQGAHGSHKTQSRMSSPERRD